MSIVKSYTFTAGTKARANEVNANFDTLYSQVNTNISNIAQNALDIDELDDTKADINGNTSQRFSVANAVTSYDAVNKQTLTNSIGNSIDIISGLTISKDSNSPTDTILVDAGSAYDSTKSIVLKLSSVTSKQNTNQGASTTYYVYIVGNSTGSLIDILISSNSTTPSLPSGYTLYRKIGSYTTNSSNEIDTISSYGIIVNGVNGISIRSVMPDITKRISISSGYVTTRPGWIRILVQGNGDDVDGKVYLNGILFYTKHEGGDFSGGHDSGFIAVDKGVTITHSHYHCTFTCEFIDCIGN